MDQPRTQEQIDALHSLGRWLRYLGIVMFLVGAYVSAFLVPDVIQTAGGPQAMSLSEAAEVANSQQTYARIEAGVWDCETLTYVEGLTGFQPRYGRLRNETKYTEIFYTDDAQDVVVFVTLSGEVDCADIAGDDPAGYLYSMSSGMQQELTNEVRLARYFNTDTFLEFCGYCGRDNSMLGAGFGLVALLGGGGLFVWGRRMGKAA
jgi:hypothetical protein